MNGRILLVEDDADLAESVRTALTAEGYEVAIAINGKEALDKLALDPLPQVILLDLMMPVTNGLEVLAVLRSQPRWARIPVIVTSANQGYDRHDLGTFAVLRKPLVREELLACTRGALFRSVRS